MFPAKDAPVDRRKDRLIRLPEVRNRTGLSTATIYRKMDDGSFPRHHKLSVHVVAWYESDVDRWVGAPMEWVAVADRLDSTQKARSVHSLPS